MRQTRVIIQSRLTSSRLPAKAMLSLADRPLIVLAAQRAANLGHEVVVATSNEPDDDVVADSCRMHGVEVVRGSLNDPLARFASASADMDDDGVVVRLTGDNPLPDGRLISSTVAALRAPDGSLRRYAHIGGSDRSVPYGIAAEAFDVGALREADSTASEAYDREHVTPYLRARFGDYVLPIPDLDPEWTGMRCTVDTFDDYVTMAKLFSVIADPINEPWQAACGRLKEISPSISRLTPRAPNAIAQGPLVLGTAQLGSPYGVRSQDGPLPSTVARDILSTAAATGVTHLDTARAYGCSETRIGVSISRGLSEYMSVVTKILPMPKESGPEFAEASLERSLRSLGTDAVAAVLLHRARDWGRPGVRDMLASFTRDGRAVLVGVSAQSPDELLLVLPDPLCQYVQLPFNLLDRRWLSEPVLSALSGRSDAIVSTRSVFLRGLLVSEKSEDWPINGGVDPSRMIDRLDALVKELGRDSRADLCVSYVLAHDWVTSVVLGAESAEQVVENGRLARRRPLTKSEVARVHEVIPGGNETICDPSRWVSR